MRAITLLKESRVCYGFLQTNFHLDKQSDNGEKLCFKNAQNMFLINVSHKFTVLNIVIVISLFVHSNQDLVELHAI